MTRELRMVRLAHRDVGRIYRWLKGRSVRGADAWYQAFRKATTKVVVDPEICAVVEEVSRLKADIREMLFKTRQGRRYRIVFEFDESEVRILRVRRPGQRPLRRRDLPAG